MTTYNLSKGPNNDTNGQILKDWINNNYETMSSITIIDEGAATIENMSNMFAGKSDIYYINLSLLNTANVTSTSNMFSGCSQTDDIFNFDTSNVIDMSNMFTDCTYGLENVPNFNTSNVTNMSRMFCGCEALINAPEFNTSNVTDMSAMFAYCYNLANVPEYNTAKVTNMVGMFEGGSNLSNASIQNIINMCINSNVPSDQRNLSRDDESSPLCDTKYNSSYYANRLSDLTNAGWSY
jgi:surface protein